MSTPDRTDPATRDAEEHEAAAAHVADRPPTPEEERLAEKNELDPKTAAAYKEMAERGANVEGEGRIG